MAWRLRYNVNIDMLGPGQGPMSGINAPVLPGGGVGQLTLELGQIPNSGPVVPGTGTTYPGGNALAAGDLTTLTNAMAADILAQLTANLSRLNNWPQGGSLSII
jgi:hypothetical protein